MKDEEIKKEIDKIVERHTKAVWTSPFFENRYIPKEEIWELKNELLSLCSYLNAKGGKSHGKAKKS